MFLLPSSLFRDLFKVEMCLNTSKLPYIDLCGRKWLKKRQSGAVLGLLDGPFRDPRPGAPKCAIPGTPLSVFEIQMGHVTP